MTLRRKKELDALCGTLIPAIHTDMRIISTTSVKT